MLETMRELALLELNHRGGENGAGLDEIRAQHGAQLAPLLVEASEKFLASTCCKRYRINQAWCGFRSKNSMTRSSGGCRLTNPVALRQ